MSTAATLIEPAVRRLSFEPGVPILLEDGQQWQLPRPRIRWRMVVRDAEASINQRTQVMLQRRRVPGQHAFASAVPIADAQDRDDAFGAQIQAIKSQGGNPYADNPKILAELQAQTRLLEQQRADRAAWNAGLPKPQTPAPLPGGIINWRQRP